jgi:hypothetical protein
MVVGPPCPSSCAQLGAQCGVVVVDPRCGGKIDCGPCATGVCGAQIPNVCSPLVTPVPDAGAAIVIADNLDSPTYIAVDTNNIYWTTYSATQGGSVMMVSLGGGKPVTLASALGRPGGLALDAASVYWTANVDAAGLLMKVGIRGGPVVTLVSVAGSPNFVGPTVAANTIYWSESTVQGAVWQTALDGSQSMLFVSNNEVPGQLTHDGTNLYWESQTGIWSAPLKGGVPTFLGSVPGGPGFGGSIAVDDRAVYSNPFTPLCTVWRTARIGGGGSSPLSLPGGPPCLPVPIGRSVAVDGTSAYWTIPARPGAGGGLGGPNNSGMVVKAPTGPFTMSAVQATPIAEGQNVPWGIAVDAKRVYWTNYGGLNGGKGQVMAALK